MRLNVIEPHQATALGALRVLRRTSDLRTAHWTRTRAVETLYDMPWPRARKQPKKERAAAGALRLFLASICRSKGSNQRYESWLIQTGFDVMPNAANDEP